MSKIFKNFSIQRTTALFCAILMVLPLVLTFCTQPVSASLTGGETVTIRSDDYNYSAGSVSYPRVIHLSGGSSRYPGHIPAISGNADNITTSNGYYIDGAGNKVFAFCIDSAKPGAGEVSGGQYAVTLSQKITDPFIIAALRLSNRSDVNSILFPGQSFANMDYWVNYAVKIVVKFWDMTNKSKALTLTEINNLTPISPPFGSSFIPANNNFGNIIITAVKNAYNWIAANENNLSDSVSIEIKCLTSNLNSYQAITSSADPTRLNLK